MHKISICEIEKHSFCEGSISVTLNRHGDYEALIKVDGGLKTLNWMTNKPGRGTPKHPGDYLYRNVKILLPDMVFLMRATCGWYGELYPFFLRNDGRIYTAGLPNIRRSDGSACGSDYPADQMKNHLVAEYAVNAFLSSGFNDHAISSCAYYGSHYGGTSLINDEINTPEKWESVSKSDPEYWDDPASWNNLRKVFGSIGELKSFKPNIGRYITSE